MDCITAKEAAEKWGISGHAVTDHIVAEVHPRRYPQRQYVAYPRIGRKAGGLTEEQPPPTEKREWRRRRGRTWIS